MSEGSTVAWTVKELLERIELKIDGLSQALNAKASQESVDHLDERLTRVEADVATLKSARAQIFAVVSLVVFIVPLAVALVMHYV